MERPTSTAGSPRRSARTRAMRIIAGLWGGRPIAAPEGTATRPTTDRVREAWMSAIATAIPGARVLDLFAGSGALGLEALSRGADHVTFVENSQAALRPLRKNIATLAAGDRVTVVRMNAMRFVSSLNEDAFDLVLADPPYGQGLAKELADIFVERRFARLLCVEHGRRDPLPERPALRSRRYGDTVLTFIQLEP